MSQSIGEIINTGGITTLPQHLLDAAGALITNQVPVKPQHVAFIMDGNRRYAKRNGFPQEEGHVAGFENLIRIAQSCYRIGVKTVTVYAFSIENFNRSKEECDRLFNMIRDSMWQAANDCNSVVRKLGWNIRFIGHRTMIEEDIRYKMDEIEKITSNGKSMVINIAAPYTTRDDIARSLELAATPYVGMSPIEVFYTGLDTYSSEPLDLLIRTSGETRFSDFMSWETTSETDFVIIPELWPELTPSRLYRIIFRWWLRRFCQTPYKCLDDVACVPPLIKVSQKK